MGKLMQKDANRLSLDSNGFTILALFIFTVYYFGLENLAIILFATLTGMVSGIVIGLSIISVTGIGLIFGFGLAEAIFTNDKLGIYNTPNYYFSKTSNFFFSIKTQKDTFEPIVADWQEEYFEALHKKEIWKARWINVRYTYGFIMAMWQKSPLGDLLEYVRKIAS
jgi:hypothetical protein